MKNFWNHIFIFLVLFLTSTVWAALPEPNSTEPNLSKPGATEPNAGSAFKPEELEQMLAPIALYPDSLLSQILMASTYPLEIVQADRWVKENKDLKGDKLAAALEKEKWDPSVKSLVNFPQVLSMMSEKLDLTQKIGDAFISQQKDVMNTIQKLRTKAQEQGTLKTTEQQVVKTEEQTIVIESPDPQVVYVPTYDSSSAYGTWPYSSYPPYSYYPPGYSVGSNLLSFGLGVGLGAAWGYAWGGCDWRGGDVDVNVNRNANFNQNINRNQYKGQYGQGGTGKWQHNPADRGGVAYRDQATAQKFNKASSADAVKAREGYRGRTDGAGGASNVGSRSSSDRAGTRAQGTSPRSSSSQAPRARTPSSASSNRGSAFNDMNKGSSTRNYSSRGQSSRQSMSRPSGGGGSRGAGGGGGRGGGGRGGGGGRR